MNISKSQYLYGLQCPKRLWLYRYKREELEETMREDPASERRMAVGTSIGELAQGYFPQGKLIEAEYWDVEAAAQQTTEQIQGVETRTQALFEACAIEKTLPEGHCYSRIDILKLGLESRGKSPKWQLVEVKSATKVKPYHINDLAYQYRVFQQAGYDIEGCYMMLIDNRYERCGDLEPQKFFYLEDISPQVLDLQEEVTGNCRRLLNTLAGPEPEIEIGGHCHNPFACPYIEYCEGAESTKQVEQAPAEEPRITSDRAALRDWLSSLDYPLYFLDYETIFPAIPIFDRSRPYQQIPFQFSLHVLERDAKKDKVKHCEYLHWEQNDPRKPFVEALLKACGSRGSILVWHQTFEKGRNKELAAFLPEYATALHALNTRVVDLIVPFRKHWLNSSLQAGSNSLKTVLPAFTELNYSELEIGDGGAAMGEYQDFQQGAISTAEQPQVQKNLLAYCCQDTLAMVRLLEVLQSHAE